MLGAHIYKCTIFKTLLKRFLLSEVLREKKPTIIWSFNSHATKKKKDIGSKTEVQDLKY